MGKDWVIVTSTRSYQSFKFQPPPKNFHLCSFPGSRSHIYARLGQLGCPIVRDNNFLVWATMIYRRITWPGKPKLEISWHQSYHSSYKHQRSCLKWLRTISTSLFNFAHTVLLFRHMGKQFYGQHCPTGQPRERKLSQPEIFFLPSIN